MNRVREIRTRLNITQQALADAAGVSRPFLVDIEKGRRGAKADTWSRIAGALGVTVTELRGDDHAVSDYSGSC